MDLLATIGTILLAPFIIISGWFAPEPIVIELPAYQPQVIEETTTLGAQNAVGGKRYFLSGSGVSAAQTTITLTNFDIAGSSDNLTMTHFGDLGCGTLEPGNSTRQEFVSFTGLTQNADGSAKLTGVVRGLLPVPDYTASTTYQSAHSGGSVFVISNSPPCFYENYASLSDNETVTGQWTFDEFPVTASTSFATETVVGSVELATGLEAASSTLTGGTTKRLSLATSISTSTGGTALTIPVTNSAGTLNESFIGNFASTTSITVGDTPLLSIGKGFWSSTTAGTSTWSVPSGILKIKVTVVGAGGKGGTAQDTDGCTDDCDGAGGGAGGYSFEYIDVSATSSIQFHIGSITSGDRTTFFGPIGAQYLSATGGSDASINIGGEAGSGSSGDINGNGQAGTSGALSSHGGTGGSSIMGGGPRGASQGSTVATTCGAGGSGENADNNPGGGGGNGAEGCIIIEY